MILVETNPPSPPTIRNAQMIRYEEDKKEELNKSSCKSIMLHSMVINEENYKSKLRNAKGNYKFQLNNSFIEEGSEFIDDIIDCDDSMNSSDII